MFRVFVILVSVILLPFKLFSQPAPQTINEVLAAMDSTSPALAAVRVDLALARAELTTSRAMPNPSLFVEQEQLSNNSVGTKETTIGARQELGFLWSLPARISAGKNSYEAGRAAYTEARRAVEADVLTSIYQIAAQRQQIALLDTILNLGLRLENVAAQRKQAGEISGFDVERVRAEVLELSSERAVLASEYSQSLTHLIEVTGLSGQTLSTLPAPVAVDPLFTSADMAVQSALSNRPLVTQTQHELAAARRALSAARWDMLPGFSLGVGQKNADEDFTGTVWEAELEIPLFQQRRTAISVLRARREFAERNRAAREHRIEQEARNAFREWQALQQADPVQTTASAANARRNVENALTLYTEGKLSALELVDALRTGFEANAAAAEIGARRLASTLQLRLATGLPVWE